MVVSKLVSVFDHAMSHWSLQSWNRCCRQSTPLIIIQMIRGFHISKDGLILFWINLCPLRFDNRYMVVRSFLGRYPDHMFSNDGNQWELVNGVDGTFVNRCFPIGRWLWPTPNYGWIECVITSRLSVDLYSQVIVQIINLMLPQTNDIDLFFNIPRKIVTTFDNMTLPRTQLSKLWLGACIYLET